MQVLLNIPDAKAPFLMDVLQHISYVKVKPLTDEKALLLQEIQEAVAAVNLVKKGKLSARPAKELLNEI
jgi:polyhydroxyalkanoate synthesis regulator phasin